MSRKTLGIVLGIVAPLAIAGAYYMISGGTPSGQPALANIDSRTVPVLQAEFNRHPEQMRVVLLLSPTCPTCLEGASSVEKILDNHSILATVFAVWEPMLPTDWAPPGRLALRRLQDPRVRQYWDPDHLVAKLFKEAGQTWKVQPECCELNGFLWDLAVVFSSGQRWNDRLPEPTFLNGTIVGSSSGPAAALLKP